MTTAERRKSFVKSNTERLENKLAAPTTTKTEARIIEKILSNRKDKQKLKAKQSKSKLK